MNEVKIPSILVVSAEGDMPAARTVRDEISEKYDIDIAVWDINLYQSNEHMLLFYNPIISVGGPAVNFLTKHLCESIPSAILDSEEIQIRYGVNRATAWGKGTKEMTKKACRIFLDKHVEDWIKNIRRR